MTRHSIPHDGLTPAKMKEEMFYFVSLALPLKKEISFVLLTEISLHHIVNQYLFA